MTQTAALAAHLDTLAAHLDAAGNMTIGSRKTAKVERTLRTVILRNGAALCAYCGQDGADALCHLLPAGPRRLGWVEGNIVPGHKTCNDLVGNADHRLFLDALTLTDVLLAWPTLRPTEATDVADRDAVRALLNSRGIPTQK